MKNLIYKELKLSLHPICYIFTIVFPSFLFIPNYPLFVPFIYVCSCYPILFLGANKGQQSNDLLYSALLPVRKKDIVMARLITVTLMLVLCSTLVGILSPFALQVHNNLVAANPDAFKDVEWIGLGIPQIFSFFGLMFISCGIMNYSFFTSHYKTAKYIVVPAIVSIVIFLVTSGLLTLVLPLAIPNYFNFFSIPYVQAITFFAGIFVYILLSFLAYKKSSKLLEKVDL